MANRSMIDYTSQHGRNYRGSTMGSQKNAQVGPGSVKGFRINYDSDGYDEGSTRVLGTHRQPNPTKLSISSPQNFQSGCPTTHRKTPKASIKARPNLEQIEGESNLDANGR
jgi:hypothetical protein